MNLLNAEERRDFLLAQIPVLVSYVASAYFIAFMMVFLFRLPVEWNLALKIAGFLLFLNFAFMKEPKLPISFGGHKV